MNIITMDNGAEVLRASIIFDRPGTVPHGVVLCYWQARVEYVVWNVYLPVGGTTWQAEAGTYFMVSAYAGIEVVAYDAALEIYKSRVGITSL